MIWKLRRCLYGLKDAPRAWYKRVVEEWEGGKMSLYDDAMFLWYNNNGELALILVTHVDDFTVTDTDDFLRNMIEGI